MSDGGEGFPRCRHGARAKPARPGWCDEPFRLFFPLGVLASIGGVMLWPLLYAGKVAYAVPLVHARVMAAFFFGAMVTGFVATAFPRMTGTARLRGWELGVLVVAQVAGTVWLLGWGDLWRGDLCFATGAVFLLAVMGWRYVVQRREQPPAGFLLVIAGIGCAVAGVALWWQGSVVVGARLLYEVFPLLVVAGAGTVVLRRFFGDEGWGGRWRWWQLAVVAAGAIGTAVWEGAVVGAPGLNWARLVRGGLVAVVLVRSVRWTGAAGSLGNAVRWGVGMTLIGALGSGVFVVQRVGVLHLMLVGGLGLVVLAVASRVVLGHTGRGEYLGGRHVPVRWVVFLVVLGAATRTVADFVPKILVTHHIYAAISWVLAVAVWFWWLRRVGRNPENPPAEEGG